MRTRAYLRGAVAAALLCTSAAIARAQDVQTPADPADTAPIHIGPLALSPRFELINVGVDSNVFNDAEGARQDFTATLRPSLDATLRFGPGRLTYRGSLDAVYFQKYSDEGSLNRFGEARLEARLTRIIPYALISGLRTRERPNKEIDLRAWHDTRTLGAGASLLATSRTSLVGSFRSEAIRYDEGALFRAQDLSRQLDETRQVAQAGLRVALTPLTTLALLGSREQDRFDLSPQRDADTWRFAPTLEFDPSALISGSISVGYRRFSPLHDTMRGFRGLVAQASTRYTLLGRTRFDAQFTRDVDYSYEQQSPYYLRTGGSLTVTQLVGGPFDVQVTAARERLEYRGAPAIAPQAIPADRTDLGGGGVGYRLGQTARIGVNVEFTRRRSDATGRSYDRRRILGALTYGF